MKKYAPIIIISTTFLILNGCLATEPTKSVEALLERPSTESRRILESAIGTLLSSQPIKLAETVFTIESTVIIEARQPKDSRGNLLDGREGRQADTVTLLTEDGKCYLKHDQSGNIKLLVSINCQKNNH
jgi:hypothetical protein